MSRDRPTQLDCLCEVQTQIQQSPDPKCVTVTQAWQDSSSVTESTKRRVDEGPVSSNVYEVLMIRTKLKTLEKHTVITNFCCEGTKKGQTWCVLQLPQRMR